MNVFVLLPPVPGQGMPSNAFPGSGSSCSQAPSRDPSLISACTEPCGIPGGKNGWPILENRRAPQSPSPCFPDTHGARIPNVMASHGEGMHDPTSTSSHCCHCTAMETGSGFAEPCRYYWNQVGSLIESLSQSRQTVHSSPSPVMRYDNAKVKGWTDTEGVNPSVTPSMPVVAAPLAMGLSPSISSEEASENRTVHTDLPSLSCHRQEHTDPQPSLLSPDSRELVAFTGKFFCRQGWELPVMVKEEPGNKTTYLTYDNRLPEKKYYLNDAEIKEVQLLVNDEPKDNSLIALLEGMENEFLLSDCIWDWSVPEGGDLPSVQRSPTSFSSSENDALPSYDLTPLAEPGTVYQDEFAFCQTPDKLGNGAPPPPSRNFSSQHEVAVSFNVSQQEDELSPLNETENRQERFDLPQQHTISGTEKITGKLPQKKRPPSSEKTEQKLKGSAGGQSTGDAPRSVQLTSTPEQPTPSDVRTTDSVKGSAGGQSTGDAPRSVQLTSTREQPTPSVRMTCGMAHSRMKKVSSLRAPPSNQGRLDESFARLLFGD